MTARSLPRFLILLGVALLLWTAFEFIDAAWSQRQARQALTVVLSRQAPPSSDATAGVSPPAIPIAPPARGDPIARLSIPHVGLSSVVLHGSDDRTLRHGPGHVERTALP